MRRFTATLAAAVFLAACGSACGTAAPATSTTAQSPCHQAGDREVTVPGPDGGQVFAVGVGSGRRAIVLIHQAGDDHCQWMATARVLAMHGVQVWAMDSSGGHGLTRAKATYLTVALDREVDPVVAAARKAGAAEIVLAGASMGGTLAIAAAARSRAVRVASLSGPDFYGGADALAAIKTLTVPVLLVAASGDTEFAKAADRLVKAAKPGIVTHLELGGIDHGVATLASSYQGKSIDDTFTAFVLGS